jgi:hypothetical protein
MFHEGPRSGNKCEEVRKIQRGFRKVNPIRYKYRQFAALLRRRNAIARAIDMEVTQEADFFGTAATARHVGPTPIPRYDSPALHMGSGVALTEEG